MHLTSVRNNQKTNKQMRVFMCLAITKKKKRGISEEHQCFNVLCWISLQETHISCVFSSYNLNLRLKYIYKNVIDLLFFVTSAQKDIPQYSSSRCGQINFFLKCTFQKFLQPEAGMANSFRLKVLNKLFPVFNYLQVCLQQGRKLYFKRAQDWLC